MDIFAAGARSRDRAGSGNADAVAAMPVKRESDSSTGAINLRNGAAILVHGAVWLFMATFGSMLSAIAGKWLRRI